MPVTGCVKSRAGAPSLFAVFWRDRVGSLTSMCRRNRRIRLQHKILSCAWYSILIRTVVDHWSHAAEIVMRGRSRGSPFQGRGFPGIVAGLGTFEDAPEQVDDKDELQRW